LVKEKEATGLSVGGAEVTPGPAEAEGEETPPLLQAVRVAISGIIRRMFFIKISLFYC
jgi:hypothetical protein